jgi:hypothetical protein
MLVALLVAACVGVQTQPSLNSSPVLVTPAPSAPSTAQPTSTPGESPTNAPSIQPTESAVPATSTPAAATESPTVAPSPTPEGTPAPIGEKKGLIVVWDQVPGSGISDSSGFSDVASANGALVAVGASGQNSYSGVWTSSDGLNWTAADFPDSGNVSIQLAAVTAGGPGFVVVGSDYSGIGGGVVWLSADGQSWERIDADVFANQTLSRVGVAGDRLVAFSLEGGVFTSADGRTWESSSDPAAQTVAAGLLALVGDGSSLWAFSRDAAEPRQNRQTILVWRSDDGETWTQTGTIDGSEGASSAWAAAGANGLVVISNAYLHDTSVWQTFYSTDGSTWVPSEQTPTDVTDVISTEAGFVAVGHYNTGQGCALIETDDVGVTWTSVDGITWRHMPERGWNGREIQVVGRSGSTLAGLGVDWNLYYDDKSSGVLWTFELPAPVEDLAPSPSPTPEPTPPVGCGP